ncbi:hypothetical protein SFUMM280S_01959 [Streptomyces fumanus]
MPGGGGAGRVLSVGEGVDPAWLGRHVAARRFGGGYAERMAADVTEVVEVPEGVSSAQAAAVLHDGVTALSPARLAKIARGEWVLVAAAAGGAGSLLVQMARDAGARVVAAARGGRKLALARELGAEAVVDYSADGWQHRVREAAGGAGVDLAFDGAGGDLGRAAFDTVAEDGRFVTYGTSGGAFTDIDPRLAAERRIRVTNALADGPPDRATVRDLLAQALTLTARGRIPARRRRHPPTGPGGRRPHVAGTPHHRRQVPAAGVSPGGVLSGCAAAGPPAPPRPRRCPSSVSRNSAGYAARLVRRSGSVVRHM